MKKWYQSRTIWTGATGLIGGIGAYFQTGDVSTLGTSVMGALMILLRVITKQPLE